MIFNIRVSYFMDVAAGAKKVDGYSGLPNKTSDWLASNYSRMSSPQPMLIK
jgi:hypothetical protein